MLSLAFVAQDVSSSRLVRKGGFVFFFFLIVLLSLRTIPVEISGAMKSDFLPIAFTNKGQGDGTGTLPDVALSVLSRPPVRLFHAILNTISCFSFSDDFFVGSMDKSADRREPFATQFQSRCEDRGARCLPLFF